MTAHVLPLATAVVPPTPTVVTPLPGPRSRALLRAQAGRESNARTYPRNLPIAIARAAGAFVEDADGNVFLDFLTGAGALSLGHNHAEVVGAVERQLGILCHGLDFPTEVKHEFTTLQLGMLPSAMQSRYKIHFCGPTGADAVEAALKLCKLYTGRSDVVCFQGSYHGSTHGALSVSSQVALKQGIGNLVPGTHFFPFPYCRRCPLGLVRDTCSTNCAYYLRHTLLDAYGGVVRPAAVILEVVQGEAGSIPAPRSFVKVVREVTEQLSIPLIVDEVQTGCGRTGTWFAFEQYDIVPDVIVTSKALGGIGMPVSVLLFRNEMDVWEPGAHIGTFRGNQLAFAAATAALRVFKRENVLQNVRERGRDLLLGLRRLAEELHIVEEVRGLGLMIGIEMGSSPHDDAGQIARRAQRQLLERGLLVELGGRDESVVRLLPPLNLTPEDAATALGIITAGLRQVEANLVSR